MTTHSRKSARAGLALAAVLSIAAATPTFAHVSLVEDTAVAGRSFKAVFGIGHGCGGKATTELRVDLPEGFVAAKPMPKPGWTLAVASRDFAKSYKVHGETVSSGPVEIRWTGGTLDDDWYDEFTIRGTFAGIEAETRLAFPVTQVCGTTTVAWTAIPAPGADAHSLDHPAAIVTVSPATAGDHAGHGMASAPQPSSGPIAVEGGFARAMLPGAKAGGGYMTIVNMGAKPDRLVAVTSPAAGKAALHMMTMEGEVMTMRPLAGGLEIPAGVSLTLAPGGTHLMFEDVKAPFRQGESVPLTLTFEKAGTVETVLAVGAPNAAGPAPGHDAPK